MHAVRVPPDTFLPLLDSILLQLTVEPYLGMYIHSCKLSIISIPHFDPIITGQAACLVDIFPAPDLRRLYQNTASPWNRNHRSFSRLFVNYID